MSASGRTRWWWVIVPLLLVLALVLLLWLGGSDEVPDLQRFRRHGEAPVPSALAEPA